MQRIIEYLFERKWKYVSSHSYVRVIKNARFEVANDARILNSHVFVEEDSSISIASGVNIVNADIYVKGHLEIGVNSIIEGKASEKCLITIEGGSFIIGHHTKLSFNRAWIRFGGDARIGSYTNYNKGGELRCDESVKIGDYCMISYNVNIWDTNTHTIHDLVMRRHITETYWPYYGKEVEKPCTKPVTLGNDVWIGKNVSILKGSAISDECIIGFGTIIAGKMIEKGRKVVSESVIRIIQ